MGVEIDMRTPLERALAKLAEAIGSRDGCHEHHFRQCPICLYLTWAMSTKGEPPVKGKLYEDPAYDRRLCDDCQQIQFKHPELFAWVSTIILRRLS